MNKNNSGFPLPKAIQAVAMAGVSCVLIVGACAFRLQAQQQRIVWSAQEKEIVGKIESLRQLPDSTRGHVTEELALQVRQLPASANKVRLAFGLATLSTEGDPGGRQTLQAVTTTLADALRDHPLPANHGQPTMPYLELASLVRIEHMQTSLKSPEFAAAITCRLSRQASRPSALQSRWKIITTSTRRRASLTACSTATW